MPTRPDASRVIVAGSGTVSCGPSGMSVMSQSAPPPLYRPVAVSHLSEPPTMPSALWARKPHSMSARSLSPATCRLTGLALRTPEGDLLENVCPIQAEFPDYLVLAATPFDLMRFELAAAEHDLESMDQGWYSTTVAGAIERLKD